MRIRIFRIFYSTTFTLLLLLLGALLLVTPADGIYQSYVNTRLWNVVIIGGAYFLTFVVGIFIYATRIYTTRVHLASIPKSYIPIRKGDVTSSVRKLTREGLERSALVAYRAHPRDLRQDENDAQPPGTAGSVPSATSNRSQVPIPTWGTIEHPGWSSPTSPDLPNLHFEPVILELPHLIEAKAVSLAPVDPLFVGIAGSSSTPDTPLPDPTAVSILQRAANIPLRDYLSHLTSLSMVQPPTLASTFLSQYESARFSTSPVSEASFRSIMSTFSTLLSSMRPPDPSLLAAAALSTTSSLRSQSSISLSSNHLDNRREHDIPFDSPISTGTVSHTPFLTPYLTPYPASLSSGHAGDGDSDTSSARTVHTAFTRPMRGRSTSRYTAPRTPRTRRTAQSRASEDSRSSEESGGSVVRRVVSESEGSEGSVVRNEGANGEGLLRLPLAFE